MSVVKSGSLLEDAIESSASVPLSVPSSFPSSSSPRLDGAGEGEEEVTMVDVHKSGWLQKRGEDMLKGWKQRWFVLDGDDTLRYFKDMDDVEERGTVQLEGCSVEFVGTDKYSRKFCFEVHPAAEKRVYVLQAASGPEMQDWLSEIKRAMLRIRRKRSQLVNRQRVAELLANQEQEAKRRITVERKEDDKEKTNSDKSAATRKSVQFASRHEKQDAPPARSTTTSASYLDYLQETSEFQRRGTIGMGEQPLLSDDLEDDIVVHEKGNKCACCLVQ